MVRASMVRRHVHMCESIERVRLHFVCAYLERVRGGREKEERSESGGSRAMGELCVHTQ